MIIKSIKIEGFRNIEREMIAFDRHYNLIHGKNASGKTSVLESIYYCAFCKSFRSKDIDLINYNRDFCRVEAVFEEERSYKVEYAISRTKGKWYKIDSKTAKNYTDIISNISMVMFCPDDLRIVKDGPAIRRNFLNKEISNLSKLYYSNLLEYNRIMKNRNVLLKKNRPSEEFEIWDEQLIEKSIEIIKWRKRYLSLLDAIASRIHFEISEGKEMLELKYKNFLLDTESKIEKEGDFLDEENLGKRMKRSLRMCFETDKKRGFTSVGPHMDDVDILINGKLSKTFSSQGQQRTAALSVKLAEVDLIKKETGKYPIVLLDDILSELDLKRQEQLKKIFYKTQVLITNAYDLGGGYKIEMQNGGTIM